MITEIKLKLQYVINKVGSYCIFNVIFNLNTINYYSYAWEAVFLKVLLLYVQHGAK